MITKKTQAASLTFNPFSWNRKHTYIQGNITLQTIVFELHNGKTARRINNEKCFSTVKGFPSPTLTVSADGKQTTCDKCERLIGERGIEVKVSFPDSAFKQRNTRSAEAVYLSNVCMRTLSN